MSTRRRGGLMEPLTASTAVVRALFRLAEISYYADQWRTVDDIGLFIKEFYQLAKIAKLTGFLINQQLNKDAATSACDSSDFNSSGIFRKKYGQQVCLYLYYVAVAK